jgi:pilus assembly protein CpaF
MQVNGAIHGGEQFPPVEAVVPSVDPITGNPDAMSRLADRVAASGEAGSLKAEGFEASVHKIKEQVLPRLLERVDPEAAATLTKEELA